MDNLIDIPFHIPLKIQMSSLVGPKVSTDPNLKFKAYKIAFAVGKIVFFS